MKHNSSVASILIVALVFTVIGPLTKVFNPLSPIFLSPFDKTHVINGTTYSNPWINVIQINNILLAIIMVITILLFFLAFKKWNSLRYYDTSIIKKLDVIAYLFVGEGILIIIISIFSLTNEVSEIKLIKFLTYKPDYGALLIIIGVLFMLITSILTNAGIVKQENDLTI